MPEIIVKLGDRIVQKYLLYKDQRMSIGRAPDNDIAIENPAVSRRHCSVQQANGRYILEDNNSANGTYVNGVRVSKTEILDKDVITIGKHKLHFYNFDLTPATPQPSEEKVGTAVAAGPSVGVLRVTLGKQRDQLYDLAKVETRIGRAADNDIRLHDWFVSKHHALIGRKGSSYVLKDLDSWRHTMVNGEIIQEIILKDGDEIQFGPKIGMRFEVTVSDEAEARQPVELGEASFQDSQAKWRAKGEPIHMAMAAMEDGEENPNHTPREEEIVKTIQGIEPFYPAVNNSHEADEPAMNHADILQIHADESPVDEAANFGDGSPHELKEGVNSNEPPWSILDAEETINETVADEGRQRRRPFIPMLTAEEMVNETVADEGRERRRKPRVEAQETDPDQQRAEASIGDQGAGGAAPAEQPAALSLSDSDAIPITMSEPPSEEVAMWEKALNNPSKVIRKQAARKLKQLTGRDYVID